MSESSQNSVVGSVFDAQRTLLDQGQFALEQSAELQRSVQRLTIESVEQVGPLQREGIQATRRTVTGLVNVVSANREDAASEELDELFERLLETHEDVFERLEAALREGSDSYEDSLDEFLETVDRQFDDVQYAHEELESTTRGALDQRSDAAGDVADQTFDTADVANSAAAEIAEQAVDAVEVTLDDASDAAADAADDVQDTTMEAADGIASDAQDAAEAAADDLEATTDDAEDRAEEAVGDAEDTVRDTLDEFEDETERFRAELDQEFDGLGEFEDETERFRAELDQEFDGLGETYRDRLVDDGFESLDDLAEATAEDIAEIAEVTEEQAHSWIDQASDRVTEREAGVSRLEDLEGIGDTYAERLLRAGIETEGQLAQTSAQRVAEVAEVSEDRAGEWVTQAQNQA